jgi:hypothetical protein
MSPHRPRQSLTILQEAHRLGDVHKRDLRNHTQPYVALKVTKNHKTEEIAWNYAPLKLVALA